MNVSFQAFGLTRLGMEPSSLGLEGYVLSAWYFDFGALIC